MNYAKIVCMLDKNDGDGVLAKSQPSILVGIGALDDPKTTSIDFFSDCYFA